MIIRMISCVILYELNNVDAQYAEVEVDNHQALSSVATSGCCSQSLNTVDRLGASTLSLT